MTVLPRRRENSHLTAPKTSPNVAQLTVSVSPLNSVTVSLWVSELYTFTCFFWKKKKVGIPR